RQSAELANVRFRTPSVSEGALPQPMGGGGQPELPEAGGQRRGRQVRAAGQFVRAAVGVGATGGAPREAEGSSPGVSRVRTTRRGPAPGVYRTAAASAAGLPD